MSRPISMFVLIFIVFSILHATPAHAQWAPSGLPIAAGPESENGPAIASDIEGGTLIAWVETVSSRTKVYVQRVSRHGDLLWGSGVAVSADTFSQSNPKVISDGAGGCFVVWTDDIDSDYVIFAQKIDEAGVLQWSANGNQVCTSATT